MLEAGFKARPHAPFATSQLPRPSPTPRHVLSPPSQPHRRELPNDSAIAYLRKSTAPLLLIASRDGLLVSALHNSTYGSRQLPPSPSPPHPPPPLLKHNGHTLWQKAALSSRFGVLQGSIASVLYLKAMLRIAELNASLAYLLRCLGIDTKRYVSSHAACPCCLRLCTPVFPCRFDKFNVKMRFSILWGLRLVRRLHRQPPPLPPTTTIIDAHTHTYTHSLTHTLLLIIQLCNAPAQILV
jgi:hypothetical protein